MASNRFVHYFDLGFETERGTAEGRDDSPPETRIELPLGGRRARRTWAWTAAAWLSLSSGIFLRQGLDVRSMDWQVQRLNHGSALAALVVGLAVLPPAMRWLNSRRRRVGAPQILVAFSLGFLLDMASVVSINPGAWLKLG